MDRSRRSNAGTRNVNNSALDALKSARGAGNSRSAQIQLRDESDVYDEVTEEQYNELVKQRRELDAFIDEDIEGLGFADDGEEYWEADENDPKRSKISKVARIQNKNNKGKPILAPNGPVSGIFLGGGRIIGPSGSSSFNESNVKLAPEQEDFYRSMINDLEYDEKLIEQSKDEQEKLAQRKKKQSMASVALFGAQQNLEETLEEVYNDEAAEMNDYLGANNGDDNNSNRITDKLTSMNAMLAGVGDYSRPPPPKVVLNDAGDLQIETPLYNNPNSSNTSNPYNNNRKNISTSKFFADENQILDLVVENSPTHTTSSVAGTQRVGLKPLPPTALANNNLQDWTTIASKLAAEEEKLSKQPRVPLATGVIASYPSAASANTDPLQNNPELSLYWYDACEEQSHPGTIYLFGKALLADRQSTASTCVQVHNIERNLFVLTRKFQLSDIHDESSVTDLPVTMGDVYNELKELMSSMGVAKFKCKTVRRSYAFDREISGEQTELSRSSWQDPSEGIPPEAEYMKLTYSFKHRALPRNLRGKTFSKVFGTKTTALELFLLKRKMMGPCWLTIAELHKIAQAEQLSHAKFEYSLESQKALKLMDSAIAPEPPLMSLISFSTKTVMNDKTGKQEIAMISFIFHDSINQDGPTHNENQFYTCTMISKLNGQAFPVDLNSQIMKLNKDLPSNRQKFFICTNERALLGLFISRLGVLDPDALLSHDLHGFGVELLMNRMRACKVAGWSKLGRLKKSNMPQSTGKLDDSFSLVDRGVGSGRLQIDSLVCAKEFLLGSKTYTLSYLAETQLKAQRQEIEPQQIPNFFNSTADLMRLTQLNEVDCFLCLSLTYKLMIIPLTKQITNLCGNLWSRTLRSIRSERVEYLLLHEFHHLKYIIPEKFSAKERKEKLDKENGVVADEEHGDAEGKENKAAKKRRGKPQYSGGLVLEPKRGFYDKFVLLLDFNSLYPSIIQEFNICFTTVKHWAVRSKQLTSFDAEEGAADTQLAALPDAAAPPGRLPKVIARLVERRREVKRMLKREADPNKCKQLDIRQKALKLIANSMYGCLGFQSSRFYCEPLAALITSQGREILQRSVELTNSLGANVIYGDTDSIMVYTNESNLEKAMLIGQAIKKEVNKRHKVLEIDIDAVFKNMLLLRKKKYAALKIVESPDPAAPNQILRQAVREVKGLDLVRRDWCGLSKDVGDYVLSRILSGAPREEVVSQIHSYLEQVKLDLQQNKVPLEKFIITKGMTKALKDYPDAKNLPHIKVAQELQAKGKQVRVGDFIPYIICEGDAPMAQRAYHPTAIQQAGGLLSIDQKWYLSNQILPPVARLCAPIEETDAARLAYVLGLDPKAFANFGSSAEQAAALDDDDLLMNLHENDEEKFKAARQLQFKCSCCKQSFKIQGVYKMPAAESNSGVKEEKMDTSAADISSNNSHIVYSGLTCPNMLNNQACAGPLPLNSPANSQAELLAFSQLSNQLLLDFRVSVNEYYSGWFKCNDSSCAFRTRDISVKGRNCLVAKCNGKLEREFSAAQLYLQLAYYQYLFDVQRAEETLQLENKRRKELEKSGNYNPQQIIQLSPDVPRCHYNVFNKLSNFVASLQEQSNYHYLPPSIFATSTSINPSNKLNKKENNVNASNVPNTASMLM
jgi:DNA polymerase alpha subunit A